MSNAITTPPTFDLVGWIMDFESGHLDEPAIIRGFQHLIDNDLVGRLNGCYGRTAERLINAGLCTPHKP